LPDGAETHSSRTLLEGKCAHMIMEYNSPIKQSGADAAILDEMYNWGMGA
jgi:hypothetical protein